MTAYRELLYKNYHSTQENRSGQDEQLLFDQQVYYFGKELVPLIHAQKSAKILDIGCGNGSMMKALMNHGFTDVEGIDLSEEQVATAKSLGLNQVQCINAEDYLKDLEEKFDVILAIDVIEHLTKFELVSFLHMLKKALKPQGRLLFRTPNMDAPLTALYSYGDFTHECLLNKSSALQVMKSAGFEQVNVLPSMILARGFIKETFRKLVWFVVQTRIKAMLFATGRTWQDSVFTPNLIILATKKES